MKFDVVIGNPPYQSGSESKGNKLWPKFVSTSVKILNDNGYMCLVVPSGWTTGGSNTPDKVGVLRDILSKNYTKVINLKKSLGSYFPNIGISFSWFVMQKRKNSGNTKVLLDNDELDIDLSKIKFMPADVSVTSITLYQKLFSRPSFEVISYDRQKDIEKSSKKTKKCYIKHWVLGTGSNIQYVYLPHDKSPEFSNKRKVLFPLRRFSNIEMVHIDDQGIPVCQQGFYVDIGNSDIESVRSVWYSKLFRFLTYGMHPTGFLKINLVKNIPKVDYSQIWTDEELYKHFNLTQEEIDYIEANVK